MCAAASIWSEDCQAIIVLCILDSGIINIEKYKFSYDGLRQPSTCAHFHLFPPSLLLKVHS